MLQLFGEAEHVGALGVLGTAAASVGRELAVWADLSLEALEGLLAGGTGAGVEQIADSRTPGRYRT